MGIISQIRKYNALRVWAQNLLKEYDDRFEPKKIHFELFIESGTDGLTYRLGTHYFKEEEKT